MADFLGVNGGDALEVVGTGGATSPPTAAAAAASAAARRELLVLLIAPVAEAALLLPPFLDFLFSALVEPSGDAPEAKGGAGGEEATPISGVGGAVVDRFLEEFVYSSNGRMIFAYDILIWDDMAAFERVSYPIALDTCGHFRSRETWGEGGGR